jgi:hypothetical protein
LGTMAAPMLPIPINPMSIALPSLRRKTPLS